MRMKKIPVTEKFCHVAGKLKGVAQNKGNLKHEKLIPL